MSTHHVAALLLADFEMFARVAYRHLHGGFELGHELYISYICRRLTKATQLGARTALNLPPRHLKTLTAAVFLSAWLLARDPTEKIIIVTYNEQLALYIAYLVRKIIRSPWFQKYFLTRLADDRTRVGDFATTAGGGVFAVSVDGAITGRGASFIIFDDPVAIADSANSQKLEQVNERFDGEIMSRLNEPRAGRVLITQHRLHPNDLTGHVLETGGWDHIGLPFIAPKDQEYDLDGRLWYRKKGELLRPDAFTAADIDRIRAIINPDFEALYQQYMGESSSVRICRGSFGTFILAPPDAPVIISVDPGHRSGPGHSFTVMQALCWAGEEVFLLDQWRAQSDVDTACRALRIGTANCRPAAVLIECSGYGPVLARSLQKRSRSVDVRLIATEHRSKVKRLLGHVDQIQRGNVKLPHDVRWREAFETEMELFPHGPFDDQVDALTQGLDYIRQSPPLKKIQPPCPGVYINHRGVATFANTMSSFGNQISYTGLGRSGRRRRIFPEQD